MEEAGAGRWADILETPGFQGWCVLLTHTKLGLPGRGARLTGDSGTKYFSKQDLETGTLSELDGGTGDLAGLNSGMGAGGGYGCVVERHKKTASWLNSTA